MGNDLKYGLVLGGVVVLIFLGWLAIRQPDGDELIGGDSLAGEPVTQDIDIFEPLPVTTTTQRPPQTLEVEISGSAGGPEEGLREGTVSPPVMPGLVDVGPITTVSGEMEDEAVREEVAAGPTMYVVQKGDVLGSISKQFYGTTTKWRLIHEANRDLIPNPNVLKPGTEIVIPDLAAAEGGREVTRETPAEKTEPRPGVRTHTVKREDTLYSIAQEYYGDGNQWKKIHEANKSKIPDPNVLKVGTELTIP